MSTRLSLLRLGLACMASVLAGSALAVSFQCPATLQETPLVKAPDSPWHVVAAAGERTLETEPVRPERMVVLDQYANGYVNGVEVWNHISIRPLQVMGGSAWQSDVNKGDGLREILFPY